jgi:hypothetical protein
MPVVVATCGFKLPAEVMLYEMGESLEIGVITSVGLGCPIVHNRDRVMPSATVRVAAASFTWSVTGTTVSRAPETLR